MSAEQRGALLEAFWAAFTRDNGMTPRESMSTDDLGSGADKN